MPQEIEYIGIVKASRELGLSQPHFQGVCRFFGIRPYQLTTAWMKHLKKSRKEFKKKHVEGIKKI